MKRRQAVLDDMVIVDDDEPAKHEGIAKRDEPAKYGDNLAKRVRLEAHQGVIRFTTPAGHADQCFDPTDHPSAPETVDAILFPVGSTGDALTAEQYYYKFIHRSADECKAEGEAAQRSIEWKRARQFAITGSDFGSAAGHNPYSSPDDLLKKKLWDVFQGNAATKWGTANEPRAAEAFLAYAKEHIASDAQLFEKGLLKFTDMPWIGVSPDGFLFYTNPVTGQKQLDLVEYKCPTRTETQDHPYAKYPSCTPPYYRDQMLGIWGYLNSHGGIEIEGKKYKLEKAWFTVWQPAQLWIVPHTFESSEWQTLLTALRKWYFGRYLPCLVWMYHGKLARGAIEPDRDAVTL